jgi:hypothetical protein
MLQGGDTVVRRDSLSDERGMVLGHNDGFVMVCWQHGYIDVSYHDESELLAVEVLDLMVEALDGKETEFRYGYPREQRRPRSQ